MLHRSRNDRVLTGLAGGLGERLGIDPVVVRLAFVVLALAGGVGVVLYLLLALAASGPGRHLEPPPPIRRSTRRVVAVGMVVAGLLVLLREAGLWLGDGIVWPAGLAALGSAVIWTRGGEEDRARWGRLLGRLPRSVGDAAADQGMRARAVLGGLLVVAGAVTFLDSNGPLALLGNAPLAIAGAVTGLAVIAGPGVWRLARQLGDERRERIRQAERAEVAAHLHDSVLQTLALIQRSSDPHRMASLARGQEHALRAWLYGRGERSPAGSLSRTVDDLAAELERAHGVRIEVVIVGDAPVDARLRALVDALREAMVNAARHSGAMGVSAYVEVEPNVVTAYVRDQGQGFERALVPADRRGIAGSIEGRMARHGGTGVVVSRPGAGTEVRLRMPWDR